MALAVALMGDPLNVPPAPDAGASMLGHYGLANPMMAWLLRRRPARRAETPTEFRRPTEQAPTCRAVVEEGSGYSRLCRRTMLFRYDGPRAVWKCYEHAPPVVQAVRRATPAMQRGVNTSLDWMLEATREGKMLDLVFDQGAWVVQAQMPEEGNGGQA